MKTLDSIYEELTKYGAYSRRGGERFIDNISETELKQAINDAGKRGNDEVIARIRGLRPDDAMCENDAFAKLKQATFDLLIDNLTKTTT